MPLPSPCTCGEASDSYFLTQLLDVQALPAALMFSPVDSIYSIYFCGSSLFQSMLQFLFHSAPAVVSLPCCSLCNLSSIHLFLQLPFLPGSPTALLPVPFTAPISTSFFSQHPFTQGPHTVPRSSRTSCNSSPSWLLQPLLELLFSSSSVTEVYSSSSFPSYPLILQFFLPLGLH